VNTVHAESLSLEDHVIGVDNIKLPQDTLQLMNSNLLDYHVEYDISYTQKNYKKVAESLHKISLSYYQLGDFDLAKNYAWRLKNVSSKYSFSKNELYANALLYKINVKQGNELLAKRFLDEYKLLLTGLSDLESEVELGSLSENEKSITNEVDDVSNEEKKNVESQRFKKFQKAMLLDSKYYLWLTIVVVLSILTFTIYRTKMRNNLHYVQIVDGGDLNNNVKEPIELTPINASTPNENEVSNPIHVSHDNLKEIDMDQKEENKNNVRDGHAKAQKLSPELIISKRAGGIFEEVFETKVPLWVSGIEHHLRDLNTINGIKYEFNYSGDFNLIKENSQNTITRFLISISETLVDANNVKSVSAQLVNSKEGLVAMIISKPINVNTPILDVITVSSIRKIFMSSNKFIVHTHNVPGGTLKFVLKRHINMREFV
jgi:hypothetical protein